MPEQPGEHDGYEYEGMIPAPLRGRGAVSNPGNRFESHRLHVLGEHLDEIHLAAEAEGEGEQPLAKVQTQVYRDRSRQVLNYVDPDKSPDIPFRWSINPYRGCEHGCIYCYARPTHEYLGWTSGLDFETKILAKLDAPQLLRKELASPRWQPEAITLSGVTDCYQPVERKLRITRQCLEVLAEAQHPLGIVTKNRLVLRDLDLLAPLARLRAAMVAISVTTLDKSLAMKLEPRASSPADRLETIAALSEAGVPVMVMVAPIIPGLNDKEVPAILEAAAKAGAKAAGYVMLRLPYQIKRLFLDWLAEHYPQRASHVEANVRDVRGGELYDARHGKRMTGEGALAKQIGQVFKVFQKRHGLDQGFPRLTGEHFRRPMIASDDGQMSLWG